MNEDKKTGGVAGFASPGGMAMLRAVVSGYLIYLGFTLIRDMLSGSSDMAPVLGWGCGLLFMLAGALSVFYTWRRWRREQTPEEERKEA